MWYFRSPEIVYGEDALNHLSGLEGRRAFIVTDATIVELGYVDLVKDRLAQAGIEVQVFSEVEPDPSLQTVRRGSERMLEYEPDWIIGLGGGSSIDAAKGMWVLYERPELDPRGINPFETLGLRRKARLICIPTTSGTGAEATWAIVLTDLEDERKLSLGGPETTPDLAIVDPTLAAEMPPWLTASTAMDALTHAVEGYTSTWHNDFADGLCLKAIQLVFEYLPRAYEQGRHDMEAREKMHNAATLAGLGFINSLTSLAHALGHALGGVFHPPHGRVVGLLLPYTIEFIARADSARYVEIARFLGLPAETEEEGTRSLAAAIRDLAHKVDEPLSLEEMGIDREDLEFRLDKLIDNAENDAQMVTSPRFPTNEELRQLFLYAYQGKPIDF